MSRECVCGMPAAPGMPWSVWHRLHERRHLDTFPDLDVRSRRVLRELADERPVTDAEIDALRGIGYADGGASWAPVYYPDPARIQACHDEWVGR